MWFRRGDDAELMSEERLDQGYVIILPGIEGRSFLNRSIRTGLLDAGVPYGIEIHDWTYGFGWLLWNIRDGRRHREQARVIAEKIVSYRKRYPTQPVYLIGHSGGGGMTVLSLEELPAGVQVSGGILIVAAFSPLYDITPALLRTRRGLWNFSSYGDFLFVGAGTTLCGTLDGRHMPSAGMLGFLSEATGNQPSRSDTSIPPLREVRYQWRMAKHLNFGGHLSCVNPRFVREWIAPIVLATDHVGSEDVPGDGN